MLLYGSVPSERIDKYMHSARRCMGRRLNKTSIDPTGDSRDRLCEGDSI